MQQREQLILKKLAEAREAQASAMTRFIQARGRVMQVEARLRSAQAYATPAPTPRENSAPAASLDENTPIIAPMLTLPGKSMPATPAPALDPVQMQVAPELSALIDESGLDALARVLSTEPAPEQNDQDIPAVVPPEPAQHGVEEDTKKQPAITLPTPPAPPVQQAEEEETLLVSMSALIEARQAREAAASAARQKSEAPVEDTSATDITTKIPVIRRERGKPQETA